MNTRTSRRSAITALGAGAASVASLSLLTARAAPAMSSAAGIVAGGTLEGPNGPVTFSAFGSRFEFEGDPELAFHGALAWHDAAGVAGAPVTISLVSVRNYGPHDSETSRLMTGTAAVNGEGEHPFALRMVDGGEVGMGADLVRLAVGSAAAELEATPVADTGFTYDVEAELTSGNIEIVSFV